MRVIGELVNDPEVEVVMSPWEGMTFVPDGVEPQPNPFKQLYEKCLLTVGLK